MGIGVRARRSPEAEAEVEVEIGKVGVVVPVSRFHILPCMYYH